MTETDQGTQYPLGPLGRPLAVSELDALDAWWRAANYLSVGQIYLLSNPLLTEPLRPEHVKQLKNSAPDYFAVRSSACAAGKRDGVIDVARVKKWKEAIGG